MFGWVGTITGIIGALLIAFNFELSKFGYLFFLVSSTTWLVQAKQNNDKALMLINIVFTVVNIIGIINWFGLV
jgi:nicotinamide riboside transporter PnuC